MNFFDRDDRSVQAKHRCAKSEALSTAGGTDTEHPPVARAERAAEVRDELELVGAELDHRRRPCGRRGTGWSGTSGPDSAPPQRTQRVWIAPLASRKVTVTTQS